MTLPVFSVWSTFCATAVFFICVLFIDLMYTVLKAALATLSWDRQRKQLREEEHWRSGLINSAHYQAHYFSFVVLYSRDYYTNKNAFLLMHFHFKSYVSTLVHKCKAVYNQLFHICQHIGVLEIRVKMI